MASLDTSMHVHITWDSEPTDEAKEFIRCEVIHALELTLGSGTWLKELVEAEAREAVKKALADIGTCMRISTGARQ